MDQTVIELKRKKLREEINQAKIFLNQNLDKVEVSNYLLPDKSSIATLKSSTSIFEKIVDLVPGQSSSKLIEYVNIVKNGVRMFKSLS